MAIGNRALLSCSPRLVCVTTYIYLSGYLSQLECMDMAAVVICDVPSVFSFHALSRNAVRFSRGIHFFPPRKFQLNYRQSYDLIIYEVKTIIC